MMRHSLSNTGMRAARLAAVLSLPLILAACELGPKESQQLGPPGAGMEQVTNLSRVKAVVPPPPSAYELDTREGERSGDVYENVVVLQDISVDEFGLLMANITEWVVPKDAPESEAGCNYCHNPENLASDEKYTKVVARKMLQMTRTINTAYKSHVKDTGVTCYTCHRGQAVPAEVWAFREDAQPMRGILNNKQGGNSPDPQVGYATLPYDSFAPYFAGAKEIRVGTPAIHPDGKNNMSIKGTEATYGLMMHMSTALGVNCTFCHNSHNFSDWTASRVQRVPAWHGIRMVRHTNNSYITPIADVFPKNANRLGPLGDPWKVNCATCHLGQNKPLGGYSMLKDNPALAETVGPLARPAAPAAIAAATAPAAAAATTTAAAPAAVVEAVASARASLGTAPA